MSITFIKDGGDLGRAELKPISALEFQIIVPHVACILESLYNSKLSTLPYKYAFEFITHQRKMIEIGMEILILPPHVHFYECDGRKLFEMRGVSGGIVSGLICYLITD
jgi:hypothetical protein